MGIRSAGARFARPASPSAKREGLAVARSAKAGALTLRMPSPLPESARLSRRTLLQGLGAVALGTAAGTAAHGFLYERHHIELTEQTLDVAGWPLVACRPSHRLPHRPSSQHDGLPRDDRRGGRPRHGPPARPHRRRRRLRDQPRSPVRPARGRGARRAVRSLRRLRRARQPRRRAGNVGGLDRCGLRGAEGCADADRRPRRSRWTSPACATGRTGCRTSRGS